MSKAKKFVEKLIEVEVTEIKTGDRISKMSGEDFMKTTRSFLGLSKTAFLDEYIEKYNQVKKKEGLSAKILIKGK